MKHLKEYILENTEIIYEEDLLGLSGQGSGDSSEESKDDKSGDDSSSEEHKDDKKKDKSFVTGTFSDYVVWYVHPYGMSWTGGVRAFYDPGGI